MSTFQFGKPITLETRGAWSKVWTPCNQQDPDDVYGTRAYVGENHWPAVGWFSYMNFLRRGEQWYSLTSDGGTTLKWSSGPSMCQLTVQGAVPGVDMVLPVPRFYRAWWFVDGPGVEGVTGIGGVSLHRDGKIAGYELRRATAFVPGGLFTLDPRPVTGLDGCSTSGGSMALVRQTGGDLWYWPVIPNGFGLARSTDRGVTWQGLRDAAGHWVNCKPAFLASKTLVFLRVLAIRNRLHMWATNWAKGTYAGVYHLVSDDGVAWRNYYASTAREFGTFVGKGVIPYWDEQAGLVGLTNHWLGYRGTFTGAL